ncbi:MAG TPA: T9SS type A sorting domain-containing protein [Rubricoccaceae bacterium]|jgi:hypothetical protein|nr:T9SS type A sorting domain-containing protein [Rubricoccaceae bacterium]
MRPLLLALILVAATPAVAQQARQSARQPQTRATNVPAAVSHAATAHAVPYASRGNTLVLNLVRAGGAGPDTVDVTAADLPPWLRLTPQRARVALSHAEVPLRFTFDVDEAAPVADTTALRFEITARTGQRWTKVVHVVVGAPQTFELEAARPNPFRTSAGVSFLVPEPSHVRLVLYDVLGRRLAVMADGEYEAGRHTVQVDGRQLASGVYVVRAEMEREDGAEVRTQRLTLVR